LRQWRHCPERTDFFAISLRWPIALAIRFLRRALRRVADRYHSRHLAEADRCINDALKRAIERQRAIACGVYLPDLEQPRQPDKAAGDGQAAVAKRD
jgi:hypothetical protein